MSNTNIDSRPWRKRHPILSRVVLFGVGAALVGTLLFLQRQRARQDEIARLRAELVSFDVLIGTPAGPQFVLETLRDRFTDPELPDDVRSLALRWEAMALRRLARAGDDEAARRIEPTYERALALAPDEAMRRGLILECVEGRLERDDVAGALALLAGEVPPADGPWALMWEHYTALAEALDDEPGDAARRIERVLDQLEPPLPVEPRIVAGGRTWNLPEVATVTTERLARLYSIEGRSELRLWRRLSDLVEFDARSQIICAQHLVGLEDEAAADRAWARAVRADPASARVWAEQDAALAALDARSRP